MVVVLFNCSLLGNSVVLMSVGLSVGSVGSGCGVGCVGRWKWFFMGV